MPEETSVGEAGGREAMRPARCRCTPTATELPEISAADQVRRSLRMSAQWARFGRLTVQQLLAEHDAATLRAEAAERALAEMRERLGNAKTKWGMQHSLEDDVRTWPTEEETRKYGGRLAHFDPDWQLVTCIVGEWKAVDGA